MPFIPLRMDRFSRLLQKTFSPGKYLQPGLLNPEIRIDTDLSKLYLELRKNSDDDL